MIVSKKDITIKRKNSISYLIIFFNVYCFANEPIPTPVTLQDVEDFINNNINYNPILLELLTPSIHTKTGLEKLIECLNKKIMVDETLECTHPAINKPDQDLVRWVEHNVVLKDQSYDDKIKRISIPLYNINQASQEKIKKQLDEYHNKTTLFYLYLCRFFIDKKN